MPRYSRSVKLDYNGAIAMPNEFNPILSILPDEQRRLWTELEEVPDSFVLFGGTAIALQLGHRTSLDFDFISGEAFDPEQLYTSLAFLEHGRTIQKAASTLTCAVDRNGQVQISFFGAPALNFINVPLVARDNQIKVASLTDLAGMKAAVVQKRAEAKDYLDLDAIISRGSVDLPTTLAAGRTLYGDAFNPEITLKALSYFGDGNLDSVPAEVRERLVAAVRSVDPQRLPLIQRTYNRQ
jgi:hypothetical protein